METKKWWMSKGVWTGVATVVIGLIALVDQNFGIDILGNPITQFVISLLGALGIYSRTSAKKTIK